MSRKTRAALVAVLSGLLFVFGLALIPSAHAATTWYVSKSGSNADGKSYATAWNELNKINWSVVQPGDFVYVDGGSSGMTYTTALSVGKSGTSTAQITVKRSPDSGHNGHVKFFGGRTALLPYCGQTGYTNQTTGVLSTIVNLNNNSYVSLDGGAWHGIEIYGGSGAGVLTGSTSSHLTIWGLEIHDMGTASQAADGSWQTDGYGARPIGSNITFGKLDIHDNGQDDIQTGGPLNSFTLTKSWLHNARGNPLHNAGYAFNMPCQHGDGMQVYNGGTQTQYSFDSDVFGPGQMQGVILGQAPSGGSSAIVNNVSLTNSLFIDSGNNIMGYPNVASSAWTMQNNTMYNAPATPWGDTNGEFYLDGSGHNVSNSVAYSGNIHLPGDTAGSNNCQYLTTGTTSVVHGLTVDPQFVTNVGGYTNAVSLDTLTNTNFALASGSPCAGKGAPTVTSVAAFLAAYGN